VIDEDVALFLADNLLKSYPALLNARYKLDTMKSEGGFLDVMKMDGVDLLDAIAKRRSYKRHDGLWDTEKTAVAFLTDYRSGAIGRISMETPESRRVMMEATLPVVAEPATEISSDDASEILGDENLE
jgi:ribosome biogenesis GTPase A